MSKTQKDALKLSRHGRDRDVYTLLKANNELGMTREELVTASSYKINEICSAIGSLAKEGLIEVMGSRVNPETGLKNEVLRTGYQLNPKLSRRGELQRLRDENKSLKLQLATSNERYTHVVKLFKSYVAKILSK